MKMTREEANEILEDWNLCHYTPSREAAEAVISALDPLEIISALRLVSREQVERMRGEWEDVPLNMDASYFATKYNLRKKCTACKYVMPREWPNFKFCPACGSPMTDEAVEMVMKRWEAVK